MSVRLTMILLVTAGAIWLWYRGTTRPVRWVVAGTQTDQRTLVVDWTQYFDGCGKEPKVTVDERATQINIRVRYRVTRAFGCGFTIEKLYPPQVVHLDRPLAGRQIMGPGQTSIPVSISSKLRRFGPVMPSVVGMNVAAARRALSRQAFLAKDLPPAETRGYVTHQRPAAGTRLKTIEDGVNPARPPHLTFGE